MQSNTIIKKKNIKFQMSETVEIVPSKKTSSKEKFHSVGCHCTQPTLVLREPYFCSIQYLSKR